MSAFRKTAIAAAMCLAAVSVVGLLSAQVKPIPVTVDEDRKLTPEETALIMQAKLNHSREILEGLVTHDFDAIEKAAVAMAKISLTPPPDPNHVGDRSDAQVFEHFRMEFARLAGQLERHARRRELDATAYAHQNLTATCIACHDYLRDDQ
ncbi:MAG: hypothetical protein R3C49_20910 [Planctomycetaceae bacterium]